MKSIFADLGVSSASAGALARRGITEPFAVQRLALPDALAGRDVLVQSPTGSGKTLAFGLALVERLRGGDARPGGLVLAPTRELASQIVEEMRDIAAARGLTVAAVYGGVGLERQAKTARRAHVVVATPGRLLDLMARRAIMLDRVRMLVLDEADRMLDMGFRPDVDRIVSTTPRDRQTLFFSATLDGQVGQVADAYTRDPVSHRHAPAAEHVAKMEHRFVSVAHDAKLERLLHELRGDRTLVFVRTRRGAERLVKRLDGHGVSAVALHGNKTQAQREKALARFEAGRVDTLVATDVAARGIDVTDLAHVINFDAPEDRDAYVHRTGRTGRAGRFGLATTFVMHDQAGDVGAIARALGLEGEFRRAGLAAPRPHGRRRARR